MSASVTFSGENMADLAAQASAFFGVTVTADAAAATTTKASGKGKAKADAEPTADKAEDEVTVDQIRAVAAKFETDEEREHAIKIIADNGAASISKLADKSAAVRKTVLEELTAKLAKVVAARSKASLD